MPEVDQLELKAEIGRILNRFFHGHGLADIASDKTFTAIAVMQLWEQGLLDLDAPANN